MIFLFGDYSVYNRNAAIYGVKSLFDKQNVPCQILTPTMDQKFYKNRAAQASGFKRGSIWSIYDAFTGRMLTEDRPFSLADFKEPEGYTGVAGSASHEYVRFDGAVIKLVTRPEGTIEAIEYYEHDDLIKRENYDDGGILETIEYPLGEEDVHTQVLDQHGQTIFELYQIGKYKKVGKVKYVPENLNFLSESDFWKWAFERLVEVKNQNDLFFIMNEPFRRAIQLAEFDSKGVYLLPTVLFEATTSKDIMFDHYEKLIFNGFDELARVKAAFDEKTDSPLYWNNFISYDRIEPSFETDKFPIYLNLGTESETVKFAEVLDFVKEVLDDEPRARFVIEFSLLRNQVDFLKMLGEAGLSEEDLKARVTPLTRPWPDRVREEMSKAILYIHYQNREALSLPLSTAVACEKPILALQGDSLLANYLTDTNGKIINDASIARLIKQAIYDLSFVKYVAPNPAEQRQFLDQEATMKRWQGIFSDTSRKL